MDGVLINLFAGDAFYMLLSLGKWIAILMMIVSGLLIPLLWKDGHRVIPIVSFICGTVTLIMCLIALHNYTPIEFDISQLIQ